MGASHCLALAKFPGDVGPLDDYGWNNGLRVYIIVSACIIIFISYPWLL